MTHLLNDDIRYACRRLWRTPGFTLTAVLTLALGMGANTVLFSLFNSVLLKAPSVPILDRLVTLTRVERATGRSWNSVRVEELAAVEASASTIFEELVIRDGLASVLSTGTSATRVNGELVSGNYFNVLGVTPRLGRLLQPADDRVGGSDTPVVISERVWRREFAGDPEVIGRGVRIANHPVVIVGVAPEAFRGTWLPSVLTSDVWVPARAAGDLSASGGVAYPQHRVLATLRHGVSIEQADAAVDTIGRQLPPWEGPSLRLAVLPGHAGLVPQEFDGIGTIVGTAVVALSGLVFLIACANLTNLLLARGAARAGELAIRSALGASRSRIIRLVLTEIAIVTMLAGLVALAFVFALTWLITALPLPMIEGVAFRPDPTPDLTVLAYAFVLMVVAALAVGLAPARRAASVAPWRAVVSGASIGAAGLRGTGTRLVAWQVAMSVVLLAGAGLYARSTIEALRFDPGYDLSRGAVASIDFTMNGIDETRGRRVLEQMLEAAARVPGVRSAALASAVPAIAPSRYTSVQAVETVAGAEAEVHPQEFQVSPGFFRTLGIDLRAGRDFSDTDAPGVVIVSARMAEALWPGRNAVGQWIYVRPHPRLLEVVGVVSDTAANLRATAATSMTVYLPAAQAYVPKMSVIVQAHDDPAAIVEPLRQALGGVDPDIAVFDVKTLTDAAVWLIPLRASAMVFGSLGLLALGIATMGVYGVMAFVVSQRTREFGVRKALGATEGEILRLVQRQGVRMIARGLVPGLVVAFLGAGFLERAIYGVHPRDPVTFIAIPVALIAAGLLASYIPARRAARVDPNVALREM